MLTPDIPAYVTVASVCADRADVSAWGDSSPTYVLTTVNVELIGRGCTMYVADWMGDLPQVGDQFTFMLQQVDRANP
jgi:hypothetical protein